MADNVELNAGSGGAVCSTDDCGAAGHAQRVKLAIATDGSATHIPADAKGLQVQQPTAADLNCTEASASAIKTAVEVIDNCIAGSEAQVDVVTLPALVAGTALVGKVGIDQVTANANEVVVKSGSVTANAGTNLNTSALATEATLGTVHGHVDSIDGKITACNTGAVVVSGSLPAGSALVGKVSIDQVTANANEVVVKSITAGDNNIGNVDVASVPAPLSTTGAGTAATALRTTSASDDPAVVALQLIDNAVSGAGFNVTQLAGAAVPIGAGTEAAAVRVTVATDSTGVVSVDDNGGTLTVDGTVTANLGATDNAVLDDIALNQTDASQKTQIVDGSGNVIGATSNALDVNIKSGAGSGGTASADDADFTAGVTNGTPAMGVYESSPSSVTDGDLGTVGITAQRALKVAIVSGAGSGGTAADDDADFTAGTTAGTPAMGVYESSPTSVTDGDLGTVGITAGRRLKTSATVDAAIAAGDNNIGNVDIVTVPAPLSVVGGGTEAAAMRVTLASDSTGVLSVDDNGSALTVDNGGTFAVQAACVLGAETTKVIGTVNIAAAQTVGLVAGVANIGDVDVLSVPAPLSTTGAGTVATALRTTLGSDDPAVVALQVIDDWDESDRAKVNPIVGQAGIAAGAGAVGATVPRVTHASDDPAVTALQIMDDWDSAASDSCSVSGDTAHDAADAGEPVKIGFKNKLFDGTAPGTTVSAENDRVDGIADGYGRQYVETAHPAFWSVSADYAGAQTNASVKAAPGANLCLFITDIVISNGAVAGNITLLDGSGGTVLFEIYPPINGGVATSRRSPIKLTANTALCITSTTVTTHSVNIGGYTAAVTGGI